MAKYIQLRNVLGVAIGGLAGSLLASHNWVTGLAILLLYIRVLYRKELEQ